MTNPKVAIIILNWNGWGDTIECLESLYQISYLNYDVIVVDNSSEDDSIEKIKEYAEGKIEVESRFFEYDPGNKPVKIIEYTREESEAGGGKEGAILDLPSNRKMIIIENEENYGFAKGNNIGMRYALKTLNPDYILLLNNDTVVDPEFLGGLVAVGGNDENIGICAAKILKAHNPRVIDSTGHVFKWGKISDRGNGEVDKGQYDDKIDILGAMAAACLYRIEMFEEIGLFDESFITMYEDAELSWRAYMNGWGARYVPGAVVYHKRGKSIKKNKAINHEVTLLYIKNTAITVKRYGTSTQKILFTILWTRNGLISFGGKMLGRGSIGIRPYIKTLLEVFLK